MRAMNIFAFSLFASICTFFAVQPAFSGWEQPPRPINPDAYTKPIDPHANSGGRRIVRIGDTIIALCPHGRGEETYRSRDNGVTWDKISHVTAFSGALVSGSDRMVYHFFRAGDRLMMEKYRYDQSPSKPAVIHEAPDVIVNATRGYHAVNATVDADGVLYVISHWGRPEQVYLLRSMDRGMTWEGPFKVSEGHRAFFYPHFEVTPGNALIGVYVECRSGGPKEIWFVRSKDRGTTWTRKMIGEGDDTYNTALLPANDRAVFVFAQSAAKSHRGLVFKKSLDGGSTWTRWWLVDATCGYADPSPALGSNGRLYVAYRSSNGTGVHEGSCGNRSRSRVVMSPDQGDTWQFVDHHYDADRTGTRSQMRYQTWWNYGGPLEWIWMQYDQDGLARPIYYDVNHEVEISNRVQPPAEQ